MRFRVRVARLDIDVSTVEGGCSQERTVSKRRLAPPIATERPSMRRIASAACRSGMSVSLSMAAFLRTKILDNLS